MNGPPLTPVSKPFPLKTLMVRLELIAKLPLAKNVGVPVMKMFSVRVAGTTPKARSLFGAKRTEPSRYVLVWVFAVP